MRGNRLNGGCDTVKGTSCSYVSEFPVQSNQVTLLRIYLQITKLFTYKERKATDLWHVSATPALERQKYQQQFEVSLIYWESSRLARAIQWDLVLKRKESRRGEDRRGEGRTGEEGWGQERRGQERRGLKWVADSRALLVIFFSDVLILLYPWRIGSRTLCR